MTIYNALSKTAQNIVRTGGVGYSHAGLVPGAAEPGIASVSGTMSDGEVITISGAGFGTRPNSPIFFTNCRDGVLTENSATVGLPCLHSNLRGEPVLVDDQHLSGGKSLRMDYKSEYSGSEGSFPKAGFYLTTPQQKLYVYSVSRMTCYLNGGLTTATMKKVRCGYGTYYHGIPGFIDQEFYNAGQTAVVDVDRRPSTSDGAIPVGQDETNFTFKQNDTWHTTEYWTDLGDTDVANGSFQQWQDRNLNDNYEDYMFRMNGFTGLYEWVISDFTGYVNYDAGNGYYLWLDQFAVDYTKRRVMIGDAPTFTGCTKCYYQPSVTWTDTEITIEANPADLAGACYLFIMDEANAVEHMAEVTV